MLHAQTEFYEHLTDPCRIVGAVLHITYGDGFTTTLTFNQYSSTVEDNDKGYQWTYTYEKDGQPDVYKRQGWGMYLSQVSRSGIL